MKYMYIGLTEHNVSIWEYSEYERFAPLPPLFYFLGYFMCGSVTVGSPLSSGGLSLFPFFLFALLFSLWISASFRVILIYSLFSIMEGFISDLSLSRYRDGGANWGKLTFNPTGGGDMDCHVDPRKNFIVGAKKKRAFTAERLATWVAARIVLSNEDS